MVRLSVTRVLMGTSTIEKKAVSLEDAWLAIPLLGVSLTVCN